MPAVPEEMEFWEAAGSMASANPTQPHSYDSKTAKKGNITKEKRFLEGRA